MADEEIKTEEEIQKDNEALRKEVAAEVFDEDPPVKKEEPEDKEEPHEEEIEEELEKPEGKEEEPSQADDISTLRKTLDDISAKMTGLDSITYRLKQTENRIGAIQNKLTAAEKKAKETPPAPTKEEIERAAAEEKSWNALKDEFPEWAEAMETRLARISTDMAGKQREVEERQREVEARVAGQMGQEITALRKEISDMQKTREETLLSFKHPDWKTKIQTPEYKGWLKDQPEAIRQKTQSPLAKDACEVLDGFDKFIKNKKSPAEIEAERKERLKQSVAIKGKKATPEKAEADMTPEELRKKVAQEVWAE